MSMSNIAHISLASLNCRGLKKILTQSGRSFSRILRSLPYDILALQETHASTEQL
jgi:exonuclease III